MCSCNERSVRSVTNLSFLWPPGSPRPDAATSRPQTHVKVAESSSLTLTFRVLAYPVPSFLWQRLANDSWQLLEHNNNNTITHSTDVSNGGLQSSLRIVNVSFSDYGVYNLNISNEVGSYDVNFTVSAPGIALCYLSSFLAYHVLFKSQSM